MHFGRAAASDESHDAQPQPQKNIKLSLDERGNCRLLSPNFERLE